MFLNEFPGVSEYLSTEICTSRQKRFSLVTFVDSPGLVDGDMKYPFDVDEVIMWLGELLRTNLARCGTIPIINFILMCYIAPSHRPTQAMSVTWSWSSLTPWVRLCASAPSTSWSVWTRNTEIGCGSTWARRTRPEGSRTDRYAQQQRDIIHSSYMNSFHMYMNYMTAVIYLQ